MMLRLALLRVILCVVHCQVWWDDQDLFASTCFLACWKALCLMRIGLVCLFLPPTVKILFWWHDGPHPRRPSYVPKRRRGWKRLPAQFCLILKSWTHSIFNFFKWTRISASEQLAKLHLKLQGVILARRNSRRLHIRKILAFKHNKQAFSRPRVKFRKHLCVFSLVCLTSLVLSSTLPGVPSHDGIRLKADFDTDSLTIGVDNRCSACLSNCTDHFVGELIKSNKVIKGYGGARVHNVWQGTMKISFEDDEGRVETFLIPNSCCVPDGDARLLSPQHWAKCFKKSQRPPAGIAPEQTFHDKVILTWNKGLSVKTIPLDQLNVATFNLAPGHRDRMSRGI
jgi:hypothetical protein